MDNFKQTQFLKAIENGLDIETASYLCGMSPASVFRLLERGKIEQERLNAGTRAKPRKSEEGALELWVEVAKNRAKSIARHLNNINMAAADDWKASKYVLEHVHPNVFGAQGSNREVEAVHLGELEGGM